MRCFLMKKGGGHHPESDAGLSELVMMSLKFSKLIIPVKSSWSAWDNPLHSAICAEE